MSWLVLKHQTISIYSTHWSNQLSLLRFTLNYIVFEEHSPAAMGHDDVINWKHFPCYWPFVREFPSHRLVTRCFAVFFDRRLKKRLNKQMMRRWFETPSRSLWRHCIVNYRASNLYTLAYFRVLCVYDDNAKTIVAWRSPSSTHIPCHSIVTAWLITTRMR